MNTREELLKLAQDCGPQQLDPLGLGGLDVAWLERFYNAAKLQGAELMKDEAAQTGMRKADNGIEVAAAIRDIDARELLRVRSSNRKYSE